MPYKLTAVGLSDIGLVRHNNEDVWELFPKWNFYILADGMGGHQAGEVAAKEAVRQLSKLIEKQIDPHDDTLEIDEARRIILEAIEEVNSHIFKLGRKDPELRGMGTTLCCLLFHPKGVIYAHVGDSRIYRLRGKKLFQMTKDDSLLRELMDQGQLNAQQAADFAYKNIITKAIGTEPHVQPSARLADIMDQDIYLMCTDGLSDPLSKPEMEEIMNVKRPLKETAQTLIDAAKEKGGNDNITVVLIKVQEKHAKKDLSRQ
jgi:serine/threonine protein phosphatase PrpC